MGYGKRALQLLIEYYEGKIANLSEDTVQPTDQEIQPTELSEVRMKLLIWLVHKLFWHVIANLLNLGGRYNVFTNQDYGNA